MIEDTEKQKRNDAQPRKPHRSSVPKTERSLRYLHISTGEGFFQEKNERSIAMKTSDVESEVIRMGDVGVAIEMVDTTLSDGETAKAERAVIILREVFENRYGSLRKILYGGERHG